MLHAVIGEDALRSPTVGTWTPRVGEGAPLAAGLLLGHLRKAGRVVDVVAPEGAGGVAASVAPAGSWLEYGDALLEIGEAVAAGRASGARAGQVASEVPAGVVVVRADTDGTVYLSPDPGSPAFAAPGAQVAVKGTLALVEVMKTFTPVRSPAAGVIEKVLVKSGASVVAGAPLFWIRT